MRIRSLMLLLLAVGAVATLYFPQLAINRQSAAADLVDQQVLEPAGSFAVAQESETVVRDMYADASGLYLLLASTKPRRDYSEVLHTDVTGTVQKRIILPRSSGRTLPVAVRVDKTGNVAVLRIGAKSEVILFNRFGAVQQTVSLNEPPSQIAYLGGNLLVGSRGKTLYPITNSTSFRPTQVDVPEPFLMRSLSGKKILFVEQTIGRLRLVDLEHVTSHSFLLSSDIPKSTPSPGREEILIPSVAVDEDDNLFCGISGHKLRDGAVAIKINAAGHVTGRFRCVLPRTQSRINRVNPEGYMYPYQVAAAMGHIFWADWDEKVIAYYKY